MKIPLSWLKKYIPINQTPEAIAHVLTMAGLEVESIETTSLPFQGIVVGQVLETQKHPNADKLCVATVSDGKNTFQVVCGAPNCRAGLKTAFAPVGATLTDEAGKEFKIKATKLRGIDSFGMLCSAKELNLGTLHAGIMELAEEAQVGTSLIELYSDTIFDISLTPNLNHCASVVGVARELSALTEIPLTYPVVEVTEDPTLPVRACTSVDVQDQALCPRYTCRVITGLKVAPSPEWLVKCLEACGLRSINNVVDATNYVLMEMGQPLHAFDFDQLEGHQIVVRSAREGEKLTTLDGKERLLTGENLVICDKTQPVALAGVMGGAKSEVGEATLNVLLESAYFQPSSIRRTSKKLGLQTDASRRFERGADPNNTIPALERATQLILQLAGGKVAAGIIDIKEHVFSEKVITCRLSRINRVLGIKLSLNEVENVFKRLNFAYGSDGQELLRIQVPTYRSDVHDEIDLIEEVARIYGYDNIRTSSVLALTSTIPHAPIYLFEKEVRSRLIAEGLQEFLTCDLIGPTILDIVSDTSMPQEAIVKVLNPSSVEQSVLRFTLLHGMLQVVKHNHAHQTHNIAGFEVGRIHIKAGDDYKEQSVAGIVLTGKTRPHHWDSKPGEVDFYDLKGMCENIFSELGVAHMQFVASDLGTFHSGRQASIRVNDIVVGSLGEVHPAILRRLDLPQRILYAEFNLHDLHAVQVKVKKVNDLPRYPASERDWTLTVSEEISHSAILDVLRSVASPLVTDIMLVDLYKSEKLGHTKKNVTYRFVYRDLLSTLSQETVDTEQARLMKEAAQKLHI